MVEFFSEGIVVVPVVSGLVLAVGRISRNTRGGDGSWNNGRNYNSPDSQPSQQFKPIAYSKLQIPFPDSVLLGRRRVRFIHAIVVMVIIVVFVVAITIVVTRVVESSWVCCLMSLDLFSPRVLKVVLEWFIDL